MVLIQWKYNMHLALFLFEPGNKASMQLFQYFLFYSISHIIVQKDTASQIIFIKEMKSLFLSQVFCENENCKKYCP